MRLFGRQTGRLPPGTRPALALGFSNWRTRCTVRRSARRPWAVRVTGPRLLNQLIAGINLKLIRPRPSWRDAGEPALTFLVLQPQPLIHKPTLRNQRFDGEGAGGVAADHLGAALHIGCVEITGRRMIRQHSQRAGPGRRIRKRQTWRGNRPERCRTGGGRDREGERHDRPREDRSHQGRSGLE